MWIGDLRIYNYIYIYIYRLSLQHKAKCKRTGRASAKSCSVWLLGSQLSNLTLLLFFKWLYQYLRCTVLLILCVFDFSTHPKCIGWAWNWSYSDACCTSMYGTCPVSLGLGRQKHQKCKWLRARGLIMTNPLYGGRRRCNGERTSIFKFFFRRAQY